MARIRPWALWHVGFMILLSSCGSQQALTPAAKTTTVDSGQTPPPPASTVALTASQMPPDSAYGESAQVNFQWTWAESINVTGYPRLPLTVGSSTRYATYVSGTGTPTLVFRYTVQAGDQDTDGITANPALELNGGTLVGVTSTNAASLSLSGHMGSLSGVTVNTSITPPAGITTLVAAPATGSSTLAVSWNKPSDNGTAITHYVLQYREKGTSSWNTHTPNPTTNNASLSGLSSGVVYELRVAASNGALGAFSSIIEAQIFNIMSFSPIAWLDGADVQGDGSSTSNGSAVSTWVDKTGVADNATEADPAKQPVYETNVQNGLGAVRFVDLDRGLEGSFPRTNGTSLTIFVVGRFDNPGTDRCMFEFIGTGSARAFFIDRRYAANTYYSPALTKDQFKLWTIRNSGLQASVTENQATTLFNGATAFNTDFTGTGTYYLGDDATGGNRLVGYIGEILIFDTDLTTQDISQIESYLMTKWGL